MKLERINIAKGLCVQKSQRIPELHRNIDRSPFFTINSFRVLGTNFLV